VVSEGGAWVAVDRAWAVRNLGLADESAAVSGDPQLLAAGPDSDEAFIADLMEFDSEGPEGQAFMAEASLSTGLSRFQELPWPKGLEPRPGPRPHHIALPKCDVLIVTWTVEEGHALSRVLTGIRQQG